jgi:hypothetical protein
MTGHDTGYYHLTPDGWARKDNEPFPANRLETWQYESATPSDAAKEQVHFVRLWASANAPAERRARLRAKFGVPIEIGHDRHITIDCRD